MPMKRCEKIALSIGWTGFNPLDSTTYFGGTPNTTCTTGALTHNIIIPNDGIITEGFLHTLASNVTGTAEDIIIELQLNNTTDYTFDTVGAAATVRNFENTALNIPVQRGDIIEIKITTPAWFTNPEAWRGYGYLILSMGRS